MPGSNILHKINEIKEIFSDIKENINAQRTSKLRRNSILLNVCTPDSCGYGGCSESVRNRELELLARIDELESAKQGDNAINGAHWNEGIDKALISELEDLRLQNKRLAEQEVRLNFAIEDLKRSTEEALRGKADEIRVMKRETVRVASMNDLLKRDNIEMESIMNKYKNDAERLQKIEKECESHKEIIRRLKSEVMDLKGAIRVFCRIRPNLNNSPIASMKFSDEALEVQDGGRKHEFSFDRIFGAHETQACIYSELSMMIQSVLDGYKACIFAYGQTGSGKTYTMEGISRDKGLIERAIVDIYEAMDTMMRGGWIFENTCTYVEIYNEEVVDLLANEVKKISIVHDSDNTTLLNCTALSVSDANEALKSFQGAACRRKTGSTNCNTRSSRSHAVYILRIRMRNEGLGQRKEGVMSLIDLAGSERLNLSKSEGIRLKETQNINKSLSALGDVFSAILRKDSHVPFRNSKLTYLLQNFLSGNSRTAMLVNISSDADHLNETMCSLRFADKVGQCKLGPIRRRINNFELS